MAPKKNKGRGQRPKRTKSPGQTSAPSDPNPTTTSPSASTPTGDATTASLVPSSASPSSPPPATTAPIIPSAPPHTTSHLPSYSSVQVTFTNQPLPRRPPPPLPIPKTHQEGISCTSDGAAAYTTHHAGPSTAPSSSAASTSTPTLVPIQDEFLSLFTAAVVGTTATLQSVKEEDQEWLELMIRTLFGLRLDDMESILDTFLGLAEQMNGDEQLKAQMKALGDVELLKGTVRGATMLLKEKNKRRDGSGGSCSGSKGGGGDGFDGDRGEGDDEGGGISV